MPADPRRAVDPVRPAPHRPSRGWARTAAAALLAASSSWAAGPAGAAADQPPGPASLPAECALAWQVELLPDTQPQVLRVTLSFDAGGRTRSTLRLPAGWAAVDESAENPADPRLRPVPDDPTLRRVDHASGERVQLRWRHRLPAGSNTAEPWWLFSGQAVLPVPDDLDERTPALACIGLAGPAPADGGPSRWLSSHGIALGSTALWQLPAAGGGLRSRVQQALYAGGAWQLQALTVEGQSLTVARPDSPALGFALPALAQAGSQALAAQRRHWGETQPGPALMLWALPVAGPATLSPPASPQAAWGSAWYQTGLVQAPAGLVPTQAALDGAVTQALARLWLLDRFGPLVQAGRDDEPLRRWFSEGVADFLAHQALLRDQRWSAADLASLYNHQIERWAGRNPAGLAATDPAALDAAAARGEWLALQWHGQLRAQGQPGLDSLMRRLLLAPAQARREGPISAPLATHRLLAALRARLGDLPLRELQRVVERGEPVWVYPDTLGPCFNPTMGAPLQVEARPQALQQAACQGWLGGGPQAGAALDRPAQALADKASPQAATARGGRAGARLIGKSKGKSAVKAAGRAGKQPSRPVAGHTAGRSAGKASKHLSAKAGSKAGGKARKR